MWVYFSYILCRIPETIPLVFFFLMSLMERQWDENIKISQKKKPQQMSLHSHWKFVLQPAFTILCYAKVPITSCELDIKQMTPGWELPNQLLTSQSWNFPSYKKSKLIICFLLKKSSDFLPSKLMALCALMLLAQPWIFSNFCFQFLCVLYFCSIIIRKKFVLGTIRK